VHHTTFVEHYAFLVGGSRVYDAAMGGPQTSYGGLQAFFWAVQPHTVVSAVAAAGLWRRAAPAGRVHRGTPKQKGN